MNPRKKRRTICYQRIVTYFRYACIAIYAIIILYVTVNWANIPFPILNSPNIPNPYNWTFTYPPSPANALGFSSSDNSLYFQMTVSANQPFADGIDIQVSAAGSMGPIFGQNVTSVTVGFLGAYPYGNPNGYLTGAPLAGVFLHPTLTHPNVTLVFNLSGPYLDGSASNIEFRNYGDFSPTIKISFSNFSDPVTYTYQDYILSIQSSESLRQGQINYGVGVFAFGTFLFLVVDLYPKARKGFGKKNS
jgi:hypothetical protein